MEGNNGGTIEKIGGTETAGTAGTEARRSSSTSRKRTATAGGTGGSGTAGNTTTTEKKQTEKSPKLVTVNVPEAEEKPKQKKKATARTPKKKETLSSDMVSDFIVGVSQVAAAKPDTKHWEINKKEAQQIAEPLCRIVEKNEKLKKVAEQSDTIALVMACVMVIAPRAFVSYTIYEEKKAAEKRKVVREVKQNDTETGTVKGSNRKNDGRNGNAAGVADVSTPFAELY